MPAEQAITLVENNEYQSESAKLLQLIERGLGKMSAEKLQATLLILRDMQKDEQRARFHTAFAQMMPKMPAVTKRGLIVIKKKGTEEIIQTTKFAKFEHLHAAVTPVLYANGFMLSFLAETLNHGRIKVTAVLGHGGYEVTSSMEGPADVTGSKNDVQGLGSTTSYIKRYLMGLILNIRFEGEDDDGNAAGAAAGPEVLSDDQLKRLLAQLDEFGETRDATQSALLNWLGVDSMQKILAKDFDRVMRGLAKKKLNPDDEKR